MLRVLLGCQECEQAATEAAPPHVKVAELLFMWPGHHGCRLSCLRLAMPRRASSYLTTQSVHAVRGDSHRQEAESSSPGRARRGSPRG